MIASYFQTMKLDTLLSAHSEISGIKNVPCNLSDQLYCAIIIDLSSYPSIHSNPWNRGWSNWRPPHHTGPTTKQL